MAENKTPPTSPGSTMGGGDCEVLVWEQDYLEVPLQDMPPPGHIIVCHDPKKRLGKITWAVLVSVSEDGYTPAKARGLFWDKDTAIMFANNLAREDELAQLRRTEAKLRGTMKNYTREIERLRGLIARGKDNGDQQ